jgi:acetyl-CoA C-acetyltransferase
MRRAVITHALRTPIGKYLGSFANLSGADLGTACVTGLLERAALDPQLVEQTIFGNGRQAGGGPNPARQVAVRSGIPDSSIAYTLNMACASGLKSIVIAAQEIERGEADVIVAGGTESMSGLPYFLPKARMGYRMGHAPIVDAMYQDGFQCPLADQLMGATAENLAEEYAISRDEQDSYAVETQRRCGEAMAAGRFEDEIVPVTVTERRRERVVDTDEHPRPDTSVEKMAKLKPVFRPDGGVHAGNSSGITDGAAAVLVMSEEKAKELGYEILAVVEGHAAAGVDPKRMGIGPVPATAKLNERLGLSMGDYDLIELNEAFAAQVISCLREWKIGTEKLNVNGGSIALGHPIGATGARIVVTLLHEMKRREAKRGLATLCVSGGMGQSVSFLRP